MTKKSIQLIMIIVMAFTFMESQGQAVINKEWDECYDNCYNTFSMSTRSCIEHVQDLKAWDNCYETAISVRDKCLNTCDEKFLAKIPH